MFVTCQITTLLPPPGHPLPKKKNSEAASIWNYQLESLDLAGVDCHNQSKQHVGQAVAKQKHLQGAISSSPHSLVDCHRNVWMENGRWNHAFDTSECETHEDRIRESRKTMATSIFQSQDLNVQSTFHMIPGVIPLEYWKSLQRCWNQTCNTRLTTVRIQEASTQTVKFCWKPQISKQISSEFPLQPRILQDKVLLLQHRAGQSCMLFFSFSKSL